jgi:hypothetical protein
VFVYQNGTLSKVYNTLGGILTGKDELEINEPIYNNASKIALTRNYIKVDNEGWI